MTTEPCSNQRVTLMSDASNGFPWKSIFFGLSSVPDGPTLLDPELALRDDAPAPILCLFRLEVKEERLSFIPRGPIATTQPKEM